MVLLLSLTLQAQDSKSAQIATNSILNENAKFLLFPTQNYHIFLKLNTRTGEVYMVQYSMEESKRLDIKIDSRQYPLVKGEEQMNGRFFLYPTTNVYNFMLLDQVDGRVWQVQWHTDVDKRIISRIYSDSKVWTLSDSIKVEDLEYRDYVYYKGSELFSGYVWSNDGKTIIAHGVDGRIPVLGYNVLHDNGKIAIFVSSSQTKTKEIEDISNFFYDENEEKLSLDDFKNKYPSLFQKAKTAFKDFQR